MSTRGTRGRGTRGRGGSRRGARAGSSSSGYMPNVEVRETLTSLAIEAGPHDCAAGNGVLSQAMLRIFEGVAGPNTGVVGHGSIMERLWSNGDEIFSERIMDDLDYSLKQKLKGAVSLLRDEAYQWWLTVKEGTHPDRLTLEFFKTTLQSKYVGASYMDARRREFLNLTQGDRSVTKYEAKFLRLSRYARGMVATEDERCVRFKDGLRDSLRVLIAPQRERDFFVLVDKAKITEEIKCAKRQNREKERGRNNRDSETSNSFLRAKKKARVDGPIRVGVSVATTGM
ncbi:uncharacterized protein LOC108458806 [Gossypium arboreum]|uniref:uncharacterized protein LOC108458806 n=1 Tax=Gossypium arboreum TaxID=29729 RepID=UPI00081967D1|nr:uncharacterized protein LOC108458806 [Gossypium arboreum]